MSYRLFCQTAILTLCCLFVSAGYLKAQDYYYIRFTEKEGDENYLYTQNGNLNLGKSDLSDQWNPVGNKWA